MVVLFLALLDTTDCIRDTVIPSPTSCGLFGPLIRRKGIKVNMGRSAASASVFGSGSVSLLLLAVAASLLVGATAWKEGRATYYGNEPWGWSIHFGSCGYYYLWPDQGTGWDVGALSDQHKDFRGSCGSCYEVKCTNVGFKDGYGQWLDRKSSCRDPAASVIIKITDSCPCSYPGNYYSNKRWCCGDMDHLDISVQSFLKLSDMKWGVIPLQYRKVACNAKPAKVAKAAMQIQGEFPPFKQGKERNDAFYYKYFPTGGYLNSKQGDGSGWVSTKDWLDMLHYRKPRTNRNSNTANNRNNNNNNNGKTTQENAPKPAPARPAAPRPAPAPAPAAAAPAQNGFFPFFFFGRR
ncbi:hypothetical protein OEZ86_007214 [Tetradesmus obliquus]|nr:hypothetical protein OEZ86_007214 [Tetradesmus obliquus]